MLEKKIEVSIQEALSAQKEKVRESLDMVTKELEKDLSDEKYSDDFKESVLRLFNVIEGTTEDAEDCALVQSQLPMINSLRVEAYGQIDRERQTIREEQKKFAYGKIIEPPETPETKPVDREKEAEAEYVPPAVPQRNTKIISDISFFKSGKMLENEADIEEYIIQLREKLLKILEEKNIRV
jgi:hypothetical protein